MREVATHLKKQMRKDLVVLPLYVYLLHPPRTSAVDAQV